MAGIIQLLWPSKIYSFSGKFNEEVLLEVSFKNIDSYQKYKAFKTKIMKQAHLIKKMAFQNNFPLQS